MKATPGQLEPHGRRLATSCSQDLFDPFGEVLFVSRAKVLSGETATGVFLLPA
jgi:hypothetical protein